MGKKSGYRPLRASTIRSILANNPSVKATAEEKAESEMAQVKAPRGFRNSSRLGYA